MKVLFVGLGSIATKHISALRELYPNVNIAALRSSPDSQDVDQIQNFYSYNESLIFNPDYIFICNPSSEHLSTIQNLIPFKKPLFIEKPALVSMQNSQDLILEISKHNIYTYVACNLRFLDCLTFLKKYLKKNEIQEISAYCGSYLPDWRTNQNFRESYSVKPQLGGGVHLDLIHELDYLFWILGSPSKSTSFLTSNSQLNIEAVDSAHYVLEYPKFLATVTLNYFRKNTKRNLEIVLPEETLTIDLLKNSVTSDLNSSPLFQSSKTAADTYKTQIESFVLNAKKSFPLNPLQEHLKVLEICLNEQSKK